MARGHAIDAVSPGEWPLLPAYRMRVEGATWRITKTTAGPEPAGSVTLRHLRGLVGEIGSEPPAESVARLVWGDRQAGTADRDRGDQAGVQIVADPAVAYAEVVLLDLDRTATVLTGMASEARRRTEAGAPGFRAGCSVLRQRERMAMETAVCGCRQRADAWVALGLMAPVCGLPGWLAGALEDGVGSSQPQAASG